jgi:hypothetical protein
MVISRHVEIWDGVMINQLKQTEYNNLLPHKPVSSESEDDNGIPVIIKFKKCGSRNVREYDAGISSVEGSEQREEMKENIRDHGGRLLRGKMIAYEYKNGYYVIKKAGALRKREREKWRIVTENEYQAIMAREKALEDKRNQNGKTHLKPNSETAEPVKWKPEDPVVTSIEGESKVGEVGITIPVESTTDDFEIIERINQVLDGGTGRRRETNSWNIELEEESRETDETITRRTRVNRLVDRFESSAFKASKKRDKKKGTNKNEFPRTVAEAMRRPDWEKWKDAIKKEMESIVKMGTFRDLNSKTEQRGKALRTKIVLTIKYNTDGSIERYKARFVILGNMQVYGDSYDETYAPVASMPSVRLFINHAAKLGLPMHQLDIMTAFLNAPMDYEVDVELDRETVQVMQELAMELKVGGFDDETRKRIAKACYGLKQAPRMFHKSLMTHLRKMGFMANQSEECLLKKHDKQRGSVWIILFVDDMLIVGDKEEEVVRFKKKLAETYDLKDMGLAQKFLGMKIYRDEQGIRLSQEHYVKTLLERFGMEYSYPMKTPAAKNLGEKLAEAEMRRKDGEEEEVLDYPVREAVGGLLYLEEMTRPDLGNAVRDLSSFLEHPTKEVVKGIKRVFRYLKGTAEKGLFFRSGGEGKLEAYVDASYAECVLTRKSITGYILTIDGDVVDWKSKKQPIVAQSSTEAEYIALAMLVNKLRVVRRVRNWLVGKDGAYLVKEDNQACIKIAEGEGVNKRSKHIDVRYHITREAIRKEEIRLEYVCTEEQLADALTKNLGTTKFQKLAIGKILG